MYVNKILTNFGMQDCRPLETPCESNRGLCFKRNSTDALGLIAQSDADWALEATDRRSIAGYCVSLSQRSSLSSWKSTKQASVALSTCDAEYMALASAMQERMYLQQMHKGIDRHQYATIQGIQ